MDAFNGLCFAAVTENDVEAMTGIMKRAFDDDAQRHLGEESGGPPGYDNGGFIRQWYLNSGAAAYKVLKDGALIGGVNVFVGDSGEYFLGNMFVDPLCQDQGVGTTIWKFIEQKYPDAKKWKTDTPGFSKRNHSFYVNKCGFKVVWIDHPRDRYEESYILEKEM